MQVKLDLIYDMQPVYMTDCVLTQGILVTCSSFRFRFLRRQDRETNKEFYPYLHYPEIYLLEGGYKSFFENYSVSIQIELHEIFIGIGCIPKLTVLTYCLVH